MKNITAVALGLLGSLVVMPGAFAAQNLTVTCGSPGQACANAAAFTVTAPGNAPVTINVKAPTSHCSDTNYTVIPAFGSRVSTGFLKPGQSKPVALGRLARGTHALLITATGRNGGCNAGRLGSWGVEITP